MNKRADLIIIGAKGRTKAGRAQATGSVKETAGSRCQARSEPTGEVRTATTRATQEGAAGRTGATGAVIGRRSGTKEEDRAGAQGTGTAASRGTDCNRAAASSVKTRTRTAGSREATTDTTKEAERSRRKTETGPTAKRITGTTGG